MILNEDVLTQRVLNKLRKYREKLYVYEGEDRWNQYKEAILDDECSMKLQYSDEGEINNIMLTSENKQAFQSINVTNSSNYYKECLNTAMDLFGAITSQQTVFI